ncbi:MAG: hypothetical protein WA192_18980 [Candidatus Acidiferrales bacterium]
MNRKMRIGVFVLVIAGLGMAAPTGKLQPKQTLTTFADGTNPPAPPVPLGGEAIGVLAMDGTNPPAPPVPLGGGASLA